MRITFTRARWIAVGLVLAAVGVLYAQEPQIFQRGIVILRGNLDMGGASGNRFCYEGSTADASETCIAVTDPTADRTITLPNETGTLTTNAGAITSSSASAGVGYATGAGCAVTQATNKSTGVTCTGMSGAVTMNGAALAAAAEVGFTVTNTSVAATDVIVLSIKSGATADSYTVTTDAVAAGSFRISVGNVSAGSLSEAVVISFAVIKAVAA